MFERSSLAARYGGSIGKTAQYRLFAKYFNRPSLAGWRRRHAVRRLGHAFVRADGWTGHPPCSDQHHGERRLVAQQSPRDRRRDHARSRPPRSSRVVEEHDLTRPAFVLTRWNRKRSNGSELDVRFFYNRNQQSDALGHDKDQSIETADVELNLPPARARAARSGLGRWDPAGARHRQACVQQLFHAGVARRPHLQRIRSARAGARGMPRSGSRPGSKVEWNSFSKFEIQPTVAPPVGADRRHRVSGPPSRVRCGSRHATSTTRTTSTRSTKTRTAAIEYALVRRVAGLQARKVDRVRSRVSFPDRQAAVGRRGVVLQRLRRSPNDRVRARRGHTSPDRGLMTPLVRANNGYGRVLGAEVTAFWTVRPILSSAVTTRAPHAAPRR